MSHKSRIIRLIMFHLLIWNYIVVGTRHPHFCFLLVGWKAPRIFECLDFLKKNVILSLQNAPIGSSQNFSQQKNWETKWVGPQKNNHSGERFKLKKMSSKRSGESGQRRLLGWAGLGIPWVIKKIKIKIWTFLYYTYTTFIYNYVRISNLQIDGWNKVSMVMAMIYED